MTNIVYVPACILTVGSPDYMEAKPLLVILHDPPEVLASPDPRTGQIDLHNTWLVSRLLIAALSCASRSLTDIVQRLIL